MRRTRPGFVTEFADVREGARVRGGIVQRPPTFNLEWQRWEITVTTTAGVSLTKTLDEAGVEEPPLWSSFILIAEVGAGTPLRGGAVAQEAPRGGLVAVRYRKKGATLRISLKQAGISELVRD
jgi:hypothetical protein